MPRSDVYTYWVWNPERQRFVKEEEEGEVSEEQCSCCEGRGFVAFGYDDVKDCECCGGE